MTSSNRTVFLAGVAFAVTALAGVIAGVALDRTLFGPPRFGGGGRGGPDQPRGAFGGPPPALRGEGSEVMILAAPPRVREQAMEALKVTPAQRATIDSIVERQVAKVREISGRVRPQIDSTMLETRALLSAVLTPAQREEVKSIRPPRPLPFDGPRRGGPPGGPPDGPPGGRPDGPPGGDGPPFERGPRPPAP